jgi:hypothetical protein
MADIAGYQPHLFSPSRSSRMRNRTSETVPSERSCLVGGARWQNSRQQERGRGTDVSHAGRDAAPLQHVVRSQCHNDIIRFAICFIFDAGCS